MHTRTLSAALLASLALLAAPALRAQTDSTDLSVELGYQWLDVNGNEDMYRTQVNDDDGFVLRDLSLTTITDGGLFDQLRVDAAGFGGHPNGRFRLEASNELYRLGLGYSQMDSFSALPAWANPFVDDLVLPGQHTWDRRRDTLDLELELMPGNAVSPLVGYRWTSVDGDRLTTRHVGQDEFRLQSDLEETEEELYAGLRFAAGGFAGQVTQGWRDASGRERLTLVPGAGGGNGSRPVLGTDVALDDLLREVETETDTPVTTAAVDGRVGDRLRLQAAFAYADAESDTTDSELLSGSLVSFALSRYFAGLDESVSAHAASPSWRGNLAAGFDLTDTVTVDARYQVRDRELDGWALISSLYLETLNFSGADPRDVEQLVEASTGLDRTDSLASLRISARELGPFVLWGEYGLADTDLEVWQDAASIVVPGAQEGRFERQVDSYSAGLGFDLGGIDASLDWRAEDADDVVLRTDFAARDRYRLRLGWKLGTTLRVVGTAEQLEADNAAADTLYDASTDRYAIEVLVSPFDQLTFRFGYDSYETTSEVLVRRPHDFGLETSVYDEEGEALEGSLTWTFHRFSADLGYSSYENQGSFPFQLDHAFARLGFDLTEKVGVAGELETYDYSEDLFAPADFDSTRYGAFVRLRL